MLVAFCPKWMPKNADAKLSAIGDILWDDTISQVAWSAFAKIRTKPLTDFFFKARNSHVILFSFPTGRLLKKKPMSILHIIRYLLYSYLFYGKPEN